MFTPSITRVNGGPLVYDEEARRHIEMRFVQRRYAWGGGDEEVGQPGGEEYVGVRECEAGDF